MDQLAEFLGNHFILSGGLLAVMGAIAVNEWLIVRRGGTRVGAGDAVRLINDRDAQVIDLRAVADFKRGHILNAVNIPLAKLDGEIDALKKKKDRPLLLCCALGSASLQAGAKLRQAGFEEVYPLTGGLNAWQNAGLPVTSGASTAAKSPPGLKPSPKIEQGKERVTDEKGGPQVLLQKIFLKDCSVEVPQAPEIFTRDWKPTMDVQINTDVSGEIEGAQQVTLAVTVTAKLDDTTAFLVEVQQAGVFRLQGVDDKAQRHAILGAYCPNVLFPYLRETVSDLIQRAGFPQFLLQPVNFDALYREYLSSQQEQAAPAH